MSSVIHVENLSKAYQIGEFSTGTLSQDIERWWIRLRGKEDRFLKIGEENDRTTKGKSNIVWSLKDINLDIKQGDAVGIIGRNGAGKSTLLKILSRVTTPTTGSVKVKGRIASLLEVGTGFHPELTGRENIFLNGAILGMRKQEIKRKFDEIVEFSGVERYIDTPVKRYSSGMYVRLAFAVAAHLESEILIIDEVLAVGDGEFQKKCLGKMKDISKGEGRTVLFVSHNIAAIQKLCNKGVFLSNGQIKVAGEISHTVNHYLDSSLSTDSFYEIPPPTDVDEAAAFATRLQIEDINGHLVNEIPVGKFWQVRVKFKLRQNLGQFIIALGLTSSTDVNIRTTWSKKVTLESGEYEVVFKEDQVIFGAGTYHLALGLSNDEKVIQYIENVASITIANVSDKGLDDSIIRTASVGFILNPMNINISRLEKEDFVSV